MTDTVKKFWGNQAIQHGTSDLATAPDHYYRELEIKAILKAIGRLKRDTILDVGCGNGYSTLAIAKKYPEAEITGIDYSAQMIVEANKLVKPNVEFFEGNVLSLSSNKHLARSHDIVLSTRCLINLASWQEQRDAITEMCELVAPDGHLILVENTQGGLDSLNELRRKVSLDPITTRWHNLYLDMTKFSELVYQKGLTMVHAENIGNMYYIASRVIYAKLCKDQGVEIDYNNPINAIAAQLPSLGEYYACSPNYMFVLKVNS